MLDYLGDQAKGFQDGLNEEGFCFFDKEFLRLIALSVKKDVTKGWLCDEK